MKKIRFATVVSSALAALAIGLAGPAWPTPERFECAAACPVYPQIGPPAGRIRTRPSASTRTSRTACGPSTEPTDSSVPSEIVRAARLSRSASRP